MDLDNYPKMVEGCTKCAVYRKKRSLSGKQQVWAKYRICAGPFSMEYFIEHTYEPSKNCMTFHLDYERLSEFSDTVGYWYVERVEDGWSRVYYSADSQLPSWVPGFARDKLIQQALRQSTSWVDRHAQRAMGKGGAEPRPLLRRIKQAGAVALALSLKARFLPGVQPLKAPREALRRLLRK
ncbi:hypothetical protein EMIHUDRAFT_420385 [Emiliania huxleyi CCMP1516]|uniref:Coenzyme Q-binding protein COQ10 START domain-containing protein n=3 Tax=Emiliania huxleyi TaxID=2903 RepID=A0A0D3J3P7_EMIH1|nr:hypothetical protein EMIHUDRAFT_420385 [Emiliania huxleyi CCMP1516]EOD18132.1 hypothetical protein EMIHUDRAFT_420385 [Emiliania huxleyi CCMP1516]|eukprot:XP_005770561.1 hypothetical protein EMIHUDRAFT_420385 [Emiliania huxleyi CCMP1516]